MTEDYSDCERWPDSMLLGTYVGAYHDYMSSQSGAESRAEALVDLSNMHNEILRRMTLGQEVKSD